MEARKLDDASRPYLRIEYTRECLLIRAERRWSSAKVIEALADVMVRRGIPQHLRSDNGPEFVAKQLRKWLADTGAQTLHIEPGSPWENDYCESFWQSTTTLALAHIEAPSPSSLLGKNDLSVKPAIRK